MDVLSTSYTNFKRIAKGAGCVVFSAMHIATLTPVAIKVIPRKENGMFDTTYIDESNFLQILDFPFCVHFYEKIETPKYLAIVMEYVSSLNLREYLNYQKKMTESAAQLYFSELCLAVNYLHEKGIVHNDLKLSNVVMDQNYHVRIIDFNMSKYIGLNSYISEKNGGSPPYMAPEIILGHRYNRNADTWSLGVILYAMISGKLPFEGNNIEEIFYKIINLQISIPSDFSCELKNLISKIFVKNPEDRISIKEIFLHPWMCKGSQTFIILNSISKLFIGAPATTAERMIKTKEATSTIEQYFHAPKPIINIFSIRHDFFAYPKCTKIPFKSAKSRRRSISCAQAKIPSTPLFIKPINKSVAPQNTFALGFSGTQKIEDFIG